MDLHDQNVIEYLQDLIIKDLASHFKGDPKSLMSAKDLDFNLSPENVQFRKELLRHIISKQNEPLLRSIQSIGININNWHQNINPDTATGIADDLEKGRKIQAIKKLREQTGFGLKEAKDIIDSFLDSDYSASIFHRQRAKDKFLAKCYGGTIANLAVNKPWTK
jgi:hypothetical protein